MVIGIMIEIIKIRKRGKTRMDSMKKYSKDFRTEDPSLDII